MTVLLQIILLIFISTDAEKVSLDAYPGYGWDHLRFMEMLPIFDVRSSNNLSTMQKCITQIPLHKSELNANSAIIDLYNSSTTDDVNQWGINGEVGYWKLSVGGSYSESYQEMKRQQGLESTVTIPNEIRYILADILLLRSCPLDLQFKSEIIQIANYIKAEQPIMATYASQVFVHRYGTHYTSRLRVGGHIIEDSFTKSKDLYVNETARKNLQWSVKASFFSELNLAVAYNTQNGHTNADMNFYQEKIIDRRISANGGQPCLIGMSVQDWELTIEDNPVILERTFENISMAIDPKQIDEVEEFYVYKTIEKINQAIDTYIQANLIYGCMNRTSNLFNWVANIEDNSCVQNVSSIQFGGFIRTCDASWIGNNSLQYSPDDLCKIDRLSNFYTSTQECPPGFTRNLLHSTSRIQPFIRNETYSCGFLWLSTCTRTVYVGVAMVVLKLYTCTKNSAGLTQYTFGGSYTSNKVNPITNDKSCYRGFSSVQIVNDIVVCFSQNSIDLSTLMKFNGMFSCQTASATTGNDMCAVGFSPYVMGIIENDCVLYACLQLRAPITRTMPSVSLPPYFNLLDQLAKSVLINSSDVNANKTNEKSMSSLRMSPVLIQQSSNLAAEKYTSWMLLQIFMLFQYITFTCP